MSADGTNGRLIRRGGSQPSWAPDGTQIAFSDGGIRIMRADGSVDRLLVDNAFIQRGDEMQRPAWSKDGQRIAFVRYDCCWEEPVAIYVVALDGTPPVAILAGGIMYSHWSPAWSPDRRSMAFIHNFELATIGVDDGALKFLGIRAAFESDLDWSPDAGRLVFADYDGPQSWKPPFTGHLRLYVAIVATGEVQRLLPEASGAAGPNYSDNHAVWAPTAR
jgi:Tol biopolymer transport system component